MPREISTLSWCVPEGNRSVDTNSRMAKNRTVRSEASGRSCNFDSELSGAQRFVNWL